MSFDPSQIDDLLEAVDAHVLNFATQNVTDRYLTQADEDLLERYGFPTENADRSVQQAFKFGMISQALSSQKAKEVTYESLKKMLQDKSFLPLDVREQGALNRLEHEAFHELRGLGGRIKKDYAKAIKESAEETVTNRMSMKKMASKIGHRTGDWARDLDRISDYFFHNAHDHGRAHEIEHELGEGAECYKHVMNQACEHCVRLYLTNGRGSKPKVFKISELRKNGNNIGRKVQDWKPVIGSTHPYCRCELEPLPQGSEWNEEKRTFEVKLTDRQKEIRERIRVKVEES